MPDDNDLPDSISLELSRDPEAGPALRDALDQRAEEWLTLCVHFARKMCLLEDYGRGIMILNEAMIWMIDANRRINTELAVEPKGKGIGIL